VIPYRSDGEVTPRTLGLSPWAEGSCASDGEIMDILACPACRAYCVTNQDALVAACASVGIEEGKTTGAMLRLYMEGYHNDGHREPG